MRILNVFGFFGILWINFDQFNFLIVGNKDLDIVIRKCNTLENASPVLRLKKHLFCDYDNTVHPNYPKTTNISLHLMPKLMTFKGDDGKLTLYNWISFVWPDPQLTWTPSDHDELIFIHVKSWEVWTPDLYVQNSMDISDDQYGIPSTDCLLYHTGTISCVPAVKFVSKCDPDFTYWPYDKHKCRVTFNSWGHKGEEVNFKIDESGIGMTDFQNNTKWDFKFINSSREAKKYKCCPNDTFPKINYNFLLTRHHIRYSFHIVLPIALMLLTLIILCLDLKSVERVAVASVNFICHLICIFHLHWQLPYNGTNPPNILLFYRESLALATFAIILTALLRKLEDMNTAIPNWISFTTTFVLNNKAGRFLILKDEFNTTDRDIVTEESSDIPKSEVNMKESSWKYFAAIIDWLSFFCVFVTYAITLIILIPT